jgi:predicted dehydrogenase
MEKLKVAVIGVGRLGKLHASLYKKVEEASLTGVYDVDKEKMNPLAKELNVTPFDSLEEAIQNSDAINIVTPTTSHFSIAKQALEQGKHIFIEKPITQSESEARQLIKMAQERNLKIQIGHIERFNPAVLALDDVKLSPLFIESHRLASFNPRGTDVAVILDLMIHDLDLILKMVKSEVTNIAASGVGVISNTIDIANARIEFANGCVANVTASRISAKKMRKMRIFQKDAYLSMDFNEGFSEIFFIPEETHTPYHDGTMAVSLGQIDEGANKREIKYNRLERSNINPLQEELRLFVESVKNDLSVVVTAEEGMAALALANKIMMKITEHKQQVDGA